MSKLLRIESPYFVAGVMVGQDAAPIVRYMTTWTEKEIRTYCRQRGWRVQELPGTGVLKKERTVGSVRRALDLTSTFPPRRTNKSLP